jgi:hypothetical protein
VELASIPLLAFMTLTGKTSTLKEEGLFTGGGYY